MEHLGLRHLALSVFVDNSKRPSIGLGSGDLAVIEGSAAVRHSACAELPSRSEQIACDP